MKIKVKVMPNSRIEEVVEEGDIILVRVKEPAKEGKANRSMVKLLANHFNISQGRITITSGLHSRNKIIQISGR